MLIHQPAPLFNDDPVVKLLARVPLYECPAAPLSDLRVETCVSYCRPHAPCVCAAETLLVVGEGPDVRLSRSALHR